MASSINLMGLTLKGISLRIKNTVKAKLFWKMGRNAWKYETKEC